MGFIKKIIISICIIGCVISLMVTGVYSAISTTLGISNTVTYTYDPPNYIIRTYTVTPPNDPVKKNPTIVNYSLNSSNQVIISDLPASLSTEDYYFVGWYTYNFNTKLYGTVRYENGSIVDHTLFNKNNIFSLFQRYNKLPTEPIILDNFGITIKQVVQNGKVIAKVTQVSSKSKTSVTIPGFITDSNGLEIPITSVEKPANFTWQSVTELTFLEPSSIKIINTDSMEGMNKLKTLILPKNLETIETTGIKGLASLEVLVIPLSVTTLGEKAFDEVNPLCEVFCEVEKPNIPDGWAKLWINGTTKIYWGNEWIYDNDGNPEKLIEKY